MQSFEKALAEIDVKQAAEDTDREINELTERSLDLDQMIGSIAMDPIRAKLLRGTSGEATNSWAD